MDPLLGQKHQYVLPIPIDAVRNQVQSLADGYCMNINLKGKLRADGSFTLFRKYSLSFTTMPGQKKMEIITGNIQPQGEKQTIILMEARPTFSILAIVYLLVISFFVCLLNLLIGTREANSYLTIVFFFFILLCRSLLRFMTNSLRKDFEKALDLQDAIEKQRIF